MSLISNECYSEEYHQMQTNNFMLSTFVKRFFIISGASSLIAGTSGGKQWATAS